jgi:hypothetical protein
VDYKALEIMIIRAALKVVRAGLGILKRTSIPPSLVQGCEAGLTGSTYEHPIINPHRPLKALIKIAASISLCYLGI